MAHLPNIVPGHAAALGPAKLSPHTNEDAYQNAPANAPENTHKHEHIVQFYENDHFLVSQVSAFLRSGIQGGGTVIVIATPEHREAVRTCLSNDGFVFDGPDAIQYIDLDAAQTLAKFMVRDWPDGSLFFSTIGPLIKQAVANKKGNGKVWVFGEMVSLLVSANNTNAAIRLEELWNELAKTHTFTLMCAYPMGLFSRAQDEDAFRQVCGTHCHVHPAENHIKPASEKEVHSIIAALQQNAAALATEVAQHKQTEKMLQDREEELSDFLENSVQPMHRVGADGRILWANQAELDLLGYSAEEYIGHPITEFHVDQKIIESILTRLQKGETIRDELAPLRHKHGAIRHVRISSNSRLVDGVFVHSRCFTRDVTDRVKLEQERRDRMRELALINRRKDEFLAMLGHELRNPLAPIATSLQLMALQGDDSARNARAREIIERQLGLMTRLVDDLLDVSRVTRGKIELNKQPVLLSSIVESAVELTRPLIDKLCHKLNVYIPEAPVQINGDPMRLAQAVANVLQNAAKYTNIGGQIHLEAHVEGDDLLIAISDNGIGLAEDSRETIFDLFVQGKSLATQAPGGLGLGLTLVRNIVSLHGGRIAAFSDGPGKGSKFVFNLPLHGPQAANDSGTLNGIASARVARPLNILIVEDNADTAESLEAFLALSGHNVRVAHSGAAAIEKALREKPEVVLLDIGMPSMDGYEVVRRLRTEAGGESATLVAITGFAHARDRKRALEAGFDHHLAKPLDLRKLDDILVQTGGVSFLDRIPAA